jgi:2-dehydro-3-deoxyphosphogluconate aldolase/(4S)-4-hydroxy-2-oxoglutarate aldolase
MSHSFVLDLIHKNAVIPLLRLERPVDALPLLEALQEGGIGAVEVWWPHANAESIVHTLREHCPDITVGAGGIRNSSEAKRAKALGAHYVSTPGLSATVIQTCAKLKLPCIPGVATTGELLLAREMGFKALLLYPATLSDTRRLVDSWHGLDAQLQFLPQGGMTQALAMEWIRLPNVPTVYGDWLALDEDLQRRQWRQITETARRASALRIGTVKHSQAA